jgi:hypothetical protein
MLPERRFGLTLKRMIKGKEMIKSKITSPFAARVLVFLLLFIGIGGLISGLMLFLSPSGELMKWSVEMLEGTPFTNFLIPGIVLFLFIGIFPILVSYGLLRQLSWRWAETINIFKKYHWSWIASLAVGVIMLIWIIVETSLLGYISFLQPVITIWGIVIIALTLLPNARNYLNSHN